jgi:hypothetical protein
MKKQAFMLALAILISGVFAIPKSAFTRDDGRYDQSRLQGRWYLDGDPNKVAEINSDRRGLEARNENGGRVRGNRIEWNNGTTWTRRPSDRYGRR